MKDFLIRQRKMVRFQMLAILLVLSLGGLQFAYGQEATTHKNVVKITSTKEGDAVGNRVIVKGTSEIHDGSQLWVLCHLKLLGGQWWPQPKPIIDANGDWQALAYIGGPQDVGYDFEIAAATFDEPATAEILKYHDFGSKTGQYLPIKFPKATSEIATVTVKKTSH